MPWVVGIDEAGYGPNLGPLVQACVALHLPNDDLTGWKTLSDLVRRVGDPIDDRLLVDDSKHVYTGPNGFGELERTVLACELVSRNVGSLVRALGPAEWDHTIAKEFWFVPEQSLPISISTKERDKVLGKLASSKSIFTGYHFAHYTTATKRFNELLDKYGSKATVVIDRLIALLLIARTAGHFPIQDNVVQSSPVHITCDKLGGRNFYGPILQEAFPDGWPVAEVEGAAESRYRILNLGRDVTVSFKPRADGENVCVALASMLAKYVREVCMKQFNDFWAKHVPGIKPTAGYPVDAKRFYAEIRPAMERLGIPEDAVWRKK